MTSADQAAAPGLGPKSLDSAVMRVFDGQGRPVGVAFLAAAGLAVTCAHVVSAALGLPEGEVPDASARVRMDLPLQEGNGAMVEATVQHWTHPEDVAVLQLIATLPGSAPIRLVVPGEIWGHPARAFGFPAGRDSGVWHSGVLRSRQADGWVQVDLDGSGYRVTGGFSGSPVWDEKLVGVVGMLVVAEAGDPPVSYLIPTSGLLRAWPELEPLVLPPSPFRGLSAFQEADAAIFYGRDGESAALARKITAESRVCLIGPSGSGKSSLALAGVLPRLRREGWAAAVMRPSAKSGPLTALAAALLPLMKPDADDIERLARVPTLRQALTGSGLADVVPSVLERTGARRLLVIVDQFEELFALDAEEVAELSGVLFADVPDVHVLTTLRADFLDTALTHPCLGPERLGGVFTLGPMDQTRLRRIITAPVEAIPGVGYEPGLVDRILTGTGDAPGALPLLGFTLELLWQQQSHGRLTHAAYAELGGVTGALGAHADRVWAEYVPKKDEVPAGRLFGRLIRLPIGSAAVTRRVAVRDELGEEEWQIALRLAATRLLVTDRDADGTETVELAHEALISGWGRLSSWVTENLAFLGWRESLRADLDRWQVAGRPPDLLPTPTGLAAADRWVRERPGDLTETEADYLGQGRSLHRSRALRRRRLRSVLAGLVGLALVLGSLFAYQRRTSAQLNALATSRALVQASVDEAAQDPVQSVMLALAAYRASPTQEARNALLRDYVAFSGSERNLSGLSGQVGTVQASRDGQVVIANSLTVGGVTLFTDGAAGTVHQQPLASDGQVYRPVVSEDGRRVGFVNIDGSAEWYDVRDVGRGLVSGPHRVAAEPAPPDNSFADNTAAMSTDGRVIAWQSGGRIVWRNLDSGAQGAVPAPKDTDGSVWFGPDDRTVLTSGLNSGTTHTQDAAAIDLVSGKTRTVVARVNNWQVSGDGTTVDYCRARNERSVTAAARVTDSAPAGRAYHGQGSCTLSGADLTGHRVVSGSTSLDLIDLDQGRKLSTVTPLANTYEPYGHLVQYGGRLMMIGNSSTRITFTSLPTTPNRVNVGQAALTPDGRGTIGALEDGTRLQLRPVQGGRRLLADAPRDAPYWKPNKDDRLEFNPAGTLVADREGLGLLSVRDVKNLREVARVTPVTPHPPNGYPQGNFTFFFQSDGRLVTRSGTRIQEWDPSTGRQLAAFDAAVFHPKTDQDGTIDLAVSRYPDHDEVTVLVWAGHPVVRVVNLRTGRVTTGFSVPADSIAVQIDPSKRYFSLLRHGSVLELWRRHPQRKELGPFPSVGSPGGDHPFVARFLDGKGRYLLAARNAVRIYRIGDRTYDADYDLGSDSTSDYAADYSFMDASADGRTVLYANSDGTGEPLVLDPAVWRQGLCQNIGYRDFTAAERSALPIRIPAGRPCG
jgi:energy-coupling factor transporter ATP-binding protein EcfA2